MKIYKARAPMRIGFFGGGTDVSPYAEEHGGKVLNCTINLYVRCMLTASADPGLTIRSLDLQEVSKFVSGREWDGKLALPQAVLDAMPHLRPNFTPDRPGYRLTMFSDAPPGSGLGSSSALVVSMLKLLYNVTGESFDPHTLAELAYRIERVDLGIPGGRQDQYAAVFGGMCVYHFGQGRVIVEPVLTDPTAILELESCLIIGYIGDRQLLRRHLMEDQVKRLMQGDTLRYHDETKAYV
ncbi:MAG: GHMP kinase, partial [Chloroflexales bacterium]|nr:GHMP kinase [Chloroflexales bacterium]